MKRSVIISTSTKSDPRWASVLARDAAADGMFYYSVKTTGVYCRPSCASRTALPKNVQFHETIEAAESAGFRPCQRCKPDQPSFAVQHAEIIAKICRLIEASDQAIKLQTLADKAGLSIYHFHRVFKAITGLTPKAYFAAQRTKRVRTELSKKTAITDAIFEAGYNSNSRFYENSKQILGMTPTEYRAGGKNTEIRFAIGKCALGVILIAVSTIGVCAIFLGDDAEELIQDLQTAFPSAHLIGGENAFEQMVAKVIRFVEAPKLGLDLPLDVRGTAFQQRVWQVLQEIPVGKTVNYTDIAKWIDMPKAARAVAGACAANTLAVAIPCHRVVRRDGELSGYRWGVGRKQALLDLEQKK